MSIVTAQRDSGSETCPCINPVDAGKIPKDGTSLMYGSTPLPVNLGSECQSDEQWWVTAGQPDTFLSPDCVGDQKPASCYSAWCYVDPCNCAMPDVLQTLVWASLYPETATKLAWSYLTCARCGSRETIQECSKHIACTWNAELQWCESTASEAYVDSECAKKDVFSCGGASNINCVYDQGVCHAQSSEEIEKAWDCERSTMGDRLCRCISPLSVGQLPNTALVRSSATNNSKLLWINSGKSVLLPRDYGSKCAEWDNVDVSGVAPRMGPCARTDAPSYCFDSWCYIDPCTCFLDPSDETQNWMWLEQYPDTSKLLAYSYATCARCHHRGTQEQCLRYSSCRWNQHQSLCYSILTEDFTQESCSKRSTNQCEANLNCKKEGDSCSVKPREELHRAWRCANFQPWPATLMPPPRGSSPASTSIGQMLYFFGGSEDELWSFDLASKRWQEIATDLHPPIRSGCMLNGNPQTSMVYMFGGLTARGKFFNDLWAFDVSKQIWVELTPDPREPAPEPRARVAMAIIRNGKGLVVFGGHTAVKLLDDLWYFDFQTNLWTYVTAAGERVEPRAAAQFVEFDSDSILLVAGTRYPIAKGDIDTVYRLSVSEDQLGRWFQPTLHPDALWGSPLGRYTSAVVPVPGNRSLVVALGYSSELHRSLQDVWLLSPTGVDMFRWKRILSEDPRWIDSSAWRETAPETHAWTGTNGVVVGESLVLGPGWSEPGVSNSLRTLNIGNDPARSALVNPACHSHDPAKNWDELPEPCRFKLLKDVPSVDVPPARSFAATVVQFGKMFLFGGLSDDDRPLADLWSYDLTENGYGWSELTERAEKNQKESNAMPSGRYKFVFLTWQMHIILGGGCADALCTTRRDDYWLLDPTLPLFTTLPPAPLELSEACAISADPYIYVYGGQAGSGAFSSILLRLEVVRRTWTEFAEARSEFARAGCSMGLSPSGKMLYAVLGRLRGDTYMDGVSFDLSAIEASSSEVTSWAIEFHSKGETEKEPNVARADMSSVALPTRGELILLGGKSWNQYPVPSDMQLVVLRLGQAGDNSGQRLLKAGRKLSATDVDVDVVPKCPQLGFCYSPPSSASGVGFQVVGHTTVHYGSQLVIFGGENGPEKSAQFLTFPWPTHLPCSEGTFQGADSHAHCKPCAPGTYSNSLDAVVCDHCPKGTANPLPAAQSLAACIPCAAGRYTDQVSSSECMLCPEGTTCPIGSIKPLKQSSQTSFGQPMMVQPAKLIRHSFKVKQIIDLVLIGCGFFTLALILFVTFSSCICGVEKTGSCLKKFDVLVSGMVSDSSGDAVHTAGGGLLTLIFILCIIVSFCPLMFGFALDNVRESEGLIPTMKVMTSMELQVTFDVDVKASLKGYQKIAECETEAGDCSPTVKVSYDGFSVPQTELSCRRIQDVAQACEVKWACRGCAFDLSVASLTITYDDRFASGYELEVETSTSSSIPKNDCFSIFQLSDVCRPKPAAEQAKSSQTYYFRADSVSVFKGSQASVLRFLAVPSVYSFDDKYSGETATGLHIFLDSFKKGSEVGPEEISKVQGVSFVLELQRGNQAMIIERSLFKKVEELFGEAGGLFGTIMGALGTAAACLLAWYATAMQHSPQKRSYLRVCVHLGELRNLRIFGKTSRVSIECFIGTNKQVQMHEGMGLAHEDMEGEFSVRRLPKFDDSHSASAEPKRHLQRQSLSAFGKEATKKVGLDNTQKDTQTNKKQTSKEKSELCEPKRLDVDGVPNPDLSLVNVKHDDVVGPTWNEQLIFYVTNNDLEDPTDIKKIPLYARLVLVDADADVPIAKTKFIQLHDGNQQGLEDRRDYQAPLVSQDKHKGQTRGATHKKKQEKEMAGCVILRTEVFVEFREKGQKMKEMLSGLRDIETERRHAELVNEDLDASTKQHLSELEVEVKFLRQEVESLWKAMGRDYTPECSLFFNPPRPVGSDHHKLSRNVADRLGQHDVHTLSSGIAFPVTAAGTVHPSQFGDVDPPPSNLGFRLGSLCGGGCNGESPTVRESPREAYITAVEIQETNEIPRNWQQPQAEPA